MLRFNGENWTGEEDLRMNACILEECFKGGTKKEEQNTTG